MRHLQQIANATIVVNAACMVLSHIDQHDWRTFTVGWVGASFAGYAKIRFNEEAHAMGEHKNGYRTLAIRIRYDINNDAWPAGTRLPSYDQLAKHYGTTRQTVGRAIKILAEDQVLEIIHGRGTFILGATPAPRAGTFEKIEGYIRDIVTQGRDARTEHIAAQSGASPSTVRRVLRQLVIQGFLRRRSDGNYIRA